MYNFSRFQAKELALAYMSGKAGNLSPEEFFLQIAKMEKSFASLLKQSQDQPTGERVKSF